LNRGEQAFLIFQSRSKTCATCRFIFQTTNNKWTYSTPWASAGGAKWAFASPWKLELRSKNFQKT